MITLLIDDIVKGSSLDFYFIATTMPKILKISHNKF